VADTHDKEDGHNDDLERSSVRAFKRQLGKAWTPGETAAAHPPRAQLTGLVPPLRQHDVMVAYDRHGGNRGHSARAAWQVSTSYRPQVSLTDADVASALAAAGLQLVERVQGEVRGPVPPGKSAATCWHEDGRFDSSPDEIVSVDDPDFVARVNAGWWRMASEYGLLDEQREFLLAVDYREPEAIDPEIEWVRVRLLDEWDLAGSGVAALESHIGGCSPTASCPSSPWFPWTAGCC
jgi:hypothetical protein